MPSSSDTRPDAYARLVDRLLASPAYGEHMAGYWMNLARWADTDGFLDDHHDRLLWPWRDWVIGAFNSNMPFDEFSTWQLAGDLLPNATREQKLATAFLRVGPRTTENGAIDEEYRVEYIVDRANTVGTAFLGMTVGCARCHDHKYDVISHKDFYSMAAFFNNADEPGFYPPGHSTMQAGPTLLWPRQGEEGELTAAEAVVRQREAVYDAARTRARRARRVEATCSAAARHPGLRPCCAPRFGRATDAHYPFEEFAPSTERDVADAAAGTAPPAKLLSPTRDPFAPPPAGPRARAGGGSGAAAAIRGRGGPPSPPGYVREGLTTSPSAACRRAARHLSAPC